MLSESGKELLWKTVLATGFFCFHKIKLTTPDGLSATLVSLTPTPRYADAASPVVAASPRCDLRVLLCGFSSLFAAYSEGKPQAASLRSNRVFWTRSAVRQGVLTTAVCDVPIAGSVMLSRPVSR